MLYSLTNADDIPLRLGNKVQPIATPKPEPEPAGVRWIEDHRALASDEQAFKRVNVWVSADLAAPGPEPDPSLASLKNQDLAVQMVVDGLKAGASHVGKRGIVSWQPTARDRVLVAWHGQTVLLEPGEFVNVGGVLIENDCIPF